MKLSGIGIDIYFFSLAQVENPANNPKSGLTPWLILLMVGIVIGIILLIVVKNVIVKRNEHKRYLSRREAEEARARADEMRQLACSHRWQRDRTLDQAGFSVNWDQYSLDEARHHEAAGLGEPKSGWRCDKCGARDWTRVGSLPPTQK